MISPRFAFVWLGLGVAISWLAAGLIGLAWLLPVFIGAWLLGGLLAMKIIDKEDDE